MSPVTLVKTRMEYGGPNHIVYKNTFDALATIARTDGLRGLYKGLLPTVVTNAPFSALYYMFYTKLKVVLTEEGRSNTLVNFTSGVCAATAATLLTQPTDVIRTRVQLGMGAGSSGLATLGHMLKSQGAGALLTGNWQDDHVLIHIHQI